MSTASSESDVIRTRIPTYDDDNTVLYAYEPNIAFFRKANIVPETPTTPTDEEDKEKTVKDVLTHCQVIHDAIQNLDKKFDVIHGKVSKIQRHRSKSFWQHRKKSLGYKHHSHLNPKKNKYQKAKKKAPSAEIEFAESYSPTLPVTSRGSAFQPSYSDFISDPELEQRLFNDQERNFSRSPPSTSALLKGPPHSYYAQDDPGPSSRPCFSSPRAASIVSVSLFSSTPPGDTTIPESVLSQSEPDQQNDPEEARYPNFLENKNTSHHTVCIPPLVTSPARSDFSEWKQTCYKDPSNWTVDDVVQFMKQIDPQMARSLTNIFRKHEIDGRALLLLKSETMMKYMGLKLGTSVKLCHYIERLKQDNYLNS